MIRRVVFAMTVLGVVGGGAGAALAGNSPSALPRHEVCVVTSDDPHHHTTDDFCVNWSGIDQ